MTPKVYFAGKVKKGGYRDLIGGNGRIMSSGYVVYKYEEKEFIYNGPFAIACDHGCFHSGYHGMISEVSGCTGYFTSESGKTQYTDDYEFSPAEIISRCYSQIRESDIFYCYIESLDCFGSLIEAGHALAWGKRVYVVVDERIKKTLYKKFDYGVSEYMKNEFWFLILDPRVISEFSKDPLSLLPRALEDYHGS